MDIRKEVFSETAIINDFLYPDGSKILDDATGKPVWIEVVGAHTDKFQHVVESTVWQGRQTKKDEKDAVAPTIADVSTNRVKGLKNLASLIVAWGGFYDNGEPLEFTEANAIKLFEAAPYIKEKVDQSIIKKLPYFKRLNPE